MWSLLTRLIRKLLFIFVCLIPASLTAEPAHMNHVSLKDQHGEQVKVDEEVKVVVFAYDMDGNDILKEAFSGQPLEFFEKHQMVIIADISGMPSFVRRFFAIPAMQKRRYPMWLDQEGILTKEWDRKPDHVTVFYLSHYQVLSSRFVDTPKALLEVISERSL